MKKRGKKAISPLIATVLLIGFTISLATLAIVWGNDLLEFVKGVSEKKLEEIDCLNIVNEINIKKTCIIADKVRIVIKNNKDMIIDSFMSKLYGIKDISSEETEANLGANSLGEVKIKFSADTIGIPRKVELRPILLNENKKLICKEILSAQISEESCYALPNFESWDIKGATGTSETEGITLTDSQNGFELNSEKFFIPSDVEYLYFYANVFTTGGEAIFNLVLTDGTASQELLKEKNIIWNRAIKIEESLKGKEAYISVKGQSLKVNEFIELKKICYSDEDGKNCIT